VPAYSCFVCYVLLFFRPIKIGRYIRGQGDKRDGPVLVFVRNLGRVEVTQGRKALGIGEYVR
jgi:hypothetical protein